MPENSNYVSGEHDHRSGGTTRSLVERSSWYRWFSKKLWEKIFGKQVRLFPWKFEFCIRRTRPSKWWHDETPRWAVLLIQTIFEETLRGNSWKTGKTFCLKIRILYQENTTIEEVARRDPPSSGSPDTEVFRNTFSGNISKTGKTISLKIRIMYQENTTIEEVARRDPSLSGPPDTDDFRKNFEREYLDNQQICLVEYWNFVSGVHDHRIGTKKHWMSSLSY